MSLDSGHPCQTQSSVPSRSCRLAIIGRADLWCLAAFRPRWISTCAIQHASKISREPWAHRDRPLAVGGISECENLSSNLGGREIRQPALHRKRSEYRPQARDRGHTNVSTGSLLFADVRDPRLRAPFPAIRPGRRFAGQRKPGLFQVRPASDRSQFGMRQAEEQIEHAAKLWLL